MSPELARMSQSERADQARNAMIFLGSVTGINARIAKDLVLRFGDLDGIAAASVEELTAIKGIYPSDARSS